MAMTKEQWIEKRMAEGLSKEQAEHEYTHFHDPMVDDAQKQKVPTRGEMIAMIAEAKQKNPDKRKVYKPDFSICDAVLKINKEIKALKGKTPYDAKRAQELSQQGLSIKLHGTIPEYVKQAEIDKTLEMPLAELIAQYKKYGKIITECEEKIDTFDVSKAQAKIDTLTAQYQSRAKNRGSFVYKGDIAEQYEKEVDKIEFEEIIKPLNDLKIKRYEAGEYFLIYEARIKHYVNENRALINEEVTAAKREEIRGSLADLVEYMEGK